MAPVAMSMGEDAIVAQETGKFVEITGVGLRLLKANVRIHAPARSDTPRIKRVDLLRRYTSSPLSSCMRYPTILPEGFHRESDSNAAVKTIELRIRFSFPRLAVTVTGFSDIARSRQMAGRSGFWVVPRRGA